MASRGSTGPNERWSGAVGLRPPLLGQLIRDIHWAFRGAVDEALAPHGLTLRQVAVLIALKRAPGQSNAELARGSLVTPQSMMDLLTGLEATGLVARPPDPGGGRALRAELTPAGETALGTCRRVIAETEARLLPGLSPDERRQLRELLERWLSSLRSMGMKPRPR